MTSSFNGFPDNQLTKLRGQTDKRTYERVSQMQTTIPAFPPEIIQGGPKK